MARRLSMAYLMSEWRRARSERRRAFLVSRSWSWEGVVVGQDGVGGGEWSL